MKHPLARDKYNKVISGVCSGIARSYEIDVGIVRLITGLLIIPFTVFVPVTYVILALILQEE